MGILEFFRNRHQMNGFTKQQNIVQDKYACYFNDNGKGLTANEIKEINDSLLNYAVLKDQNDIDFMTEYFAIANLTSGHKISQIIEARKEIMVRIEAGEVIGKCESAILAKNVIIKKPNDAYVVSIDNNPKCLQVEKTHYLDLSEKEKEKVLKEVQKYDKVAKSKYSFDVM